MGCPFAWLVQNLGTAPLQLEAPAEMLVSRLSFSHFELMLALNDFLQRAFYDEEEGLRERWSVRELRAGVVPGHPIVVSLFIPSTLFHIDMKRKGWNRQL